MSCCTRQIPGACIETADAEWGMITRKTRGFFGETREKPTASGIGHIRGTVLGSRTSRAIDSACEISNRWVGEWRFDEFLPHQHSAVYIEHVAGDIGGFFGSEEAHGLGHIFGCANAAERDHFQRVLSELVR